MMILLMLLAIQDVDSDIERLGASDPAVREKATAALLEAGDGAAPALLKACESSDAEVKSRAQAIVDQLGARQPASVLALSLKPVEGGVELTCVNTSKLPVRVHRLSLGVELEKPREDVVLEVTSDKLPGAEFAEFMRLAPGEKTTLRLCVERRSGREAVKLVPVYRFDRAAFGALCEGGALAVDGSRAGDATDVTPAVAGGEVKEKSVRMCTLKRKAPAPIGKALTAAFRLRSGVSFSAVEDAGVLVLNVEDDETSRFLEDLITALDRPK